MHICVYLKDELKKKKNMKRTIKFRKGRRGKRAKAGRRDKTIGRDRGAKRFIDSINILSHYAHMIFSYVSYQDIISDPRYFQSLRYPESNYISSIISRMRPDQYPTSGQLARQNRESRSVNSGEYPTVAVKRWQRSSCHFTLFKVKFCNNRKITRAGIPFGAL